MNGVTAGNSFFQYICTSRISHTLQALGEKRSLGGYENTVPELQDVPLLFGIKTRRSNGPFDERGDLAGFGTFGEVDSFQH